MHGPRMRVRAGFTLAEVIIALSLLTLTLSSLAGLAASVSFRSLQSSRVARRSATISEQASRLGALPFDSLPSRAGCLTDTSSVFPHSRCITVVDEAPNRRSIEVVVTPSVGTVKADTVMLLRTRPAGGNPLSP